MFKETKRTIIRALGNDATDTVLRRAPSGRSVHIWVHLMKPIKSDEEWLLYSLLLKEDQAKST